MCVCVEKEFHSMYSFISSSGASKSGDIYVIIPLQRPGPGREGFAGFVNSLTNNRLDLLE